jgi:hypothetical protein
VFVTWLFRISDGTQSCIPHVSHIIGQHKLHIIGQHKLDHYTSFHTLPTSLLILIWSFDTTQDFLTGSVVRYFTNINHPVCFRNISRDRIVGQAAVLGGDNRKVKGKVFPLQAWSGSWGSRRLRLLDLLNIRHCEGGKVVTLTHRSSLSPGVFLALIFRGWGDPTAHGSVGSFGKEPQRHHWGSIPRPSD